MKKSVKKLVQLSDSYNRSTNLELDFEDPARLQGIHVSSKFQKGLKEILSSILEANSNHRVRVLSGSPGLGKSTFALFTAQAVFKKRPKIIRERLKKSSKALREQFNRFQNSSKTKLLPVFINGYEGNIEEVFINKLQRSLSYIGLPKKHNSKNALKCYQESIGFLKKRGYGGIFVIYDEFGKYLERAVHNPGNLNMQFLQNFAEFCNRSGANQCHLTLITHLSISHYAGRLPFNVQREWAKIEGRFQESAFYDKNFDYYKMISAVFKKNIEKTAPAMAKKYKSYIKKYKSNFQADALEGFIDSKEVEKTLLNCFPLHPAVLSLLPYLSIKVAQNERTLYTFLTRDENNSLKRFLDERFQDETTLITPYHLYQYFSPLIGKDIGIGGSYKIQLMAERAFTQINRKDEVSKQVISLMALCSVIKNSHFAPLTEEFISSCFNQTFSIKEVKKSLKTLRDKKIVFYNKQARQYLLQEGSPIDIDEEIAKLKAVTLTSKKLVQILKRYFKPNFIIPKKYNFDHAITRFYRTQIISVEELNNIKKNKIIDFYKEDGLALYVIPFSHDELAYAKSQIQKITDPLVVFILPKQFIECKKDIEKLNAIDCLYNNKEILSAGPLVKKELDCHKDILLASLRSLLKSLIGYMDLSAVAVYPKESLLKGRQADLKDISHFKELERLLGALFKREYSKYIPFNLEHTNRHSVSGSVTLGRKKLINLLISKKSNLIKNIENIKIGQGPDYAIFNVMKKLSRFKFNEEENIYKVFRKSDYYQFFVEYKKILSAHPQGIKGKKMLDILIAPPYGLRLGVIPVFIALADLCFKQPVSHYFDSSYVKDPDGDHYDLLMKYPAKTAIHYTPIDNKQQNFLDGLSKIFKAKDGSIGSVLEALLKWRKSIPESTKKSSLLSLTGRKLLIHIDSSKEPDQLLFKKLPECFNRSSINDKGCSIDQINKILSFTEKTKKEIDGVYRNLLLKIKNDLANFIEFIDKECLNSLKGLSCKKGDMVQDFQNVLSKLKNYPFSEGAGRFIGRALHFDPSNHRQYFFETIADVLTGSSPRYWDSFGYSKFEFALKKIKIEIELVCEIAHPAFKGQSVLAFIDRGSDKKTFLKLGAFPGKDKRLLQAVGRIKSVLDSFDEPDKRKIILTILESLDKQLFVKRSFEKDLIKSAKGPVINA